MLAASGDAVPQIIFGGSTVGFKKEGYEPEVAVVVCHAWYPDSPFTFFFPKVLPQAALDAEKTYFGLTDAEGKDASRLALINVVAELSTRAPEGFDDASGTGASSLADAIRTYFDDPSMPELEQIVVAAWTTYKQGARPSAYLKSGTGDGAGSGHAASVPQQAQP
jgi:hypothetical protein